MSAETEAMVSALKAEAAFKLTNSLDFKGAVACYTKLLSLSDANSISTYIIYNNRALAHLGAGNIQSAIQDCDTLKLTAERHLH
jgi:hypothetical protein